MLDEESRGADADELNTYTTPYSLSYVRTFRP